jgi:hypothetical protein
MADYVEIRRVTIIAECALENELIEMFYRRGAKGYTSIPCVGKGQQGVVADPFTGQNLVKLEVLARKEVAEAIFDQMHRSPLKRYPTICFLDPILAHPDAQFY